MGNGGGRDSDSFGGDEDAKTIRCDLFYIMVPTQTLYQQSSPTVERSLRELGKFSLGFHRNWVTIVRANACDGLG